MRRLVGSETRATGAMPVKGIGQGREDFIERPVDHVDQGIGMTERGSHGLGAKQSLPLLPHLGPAEAQCGEKDFMHAFILDLALDFGSARLGEGRAWVGAHFLLGL